MKLLARLIAAAILALIVCSSPAQLAPGAGDMPGLDKAMRKLFEKVEGFTSTTLMTIGGGGQNVTLTVSISMLNGDSRTEVDLAKMEGASIPAEMLNQLRAAGMDRMVTMSYAKDGRSLMIYPGMKAYAEFGGAKAANGKEPECTMEKTVTGMEDIGGKSCEKCSVKFKCEGSPDVTMTVWADKGHKDRPVKIATSQDGVNLTMEFKDFKEAKPDAKLFGRPTEYKKYNSVDELMAANMQKLMQTVPTK
jgi:outer membrane lipoprotein-sorting protein